ncbi:hypothetical protein C0J52_09006 [Blattella germanica]|nr:hypothetical protein C0J52_09006 [Blattella germanica]
MLHITVVMIIIIGVVSSMDDDLSQARFDSFKHDLLEAIEIDKEIDKQHNELAQYFEERSGIGSLELRNSCNSYVSARRQFLTKIININKFIEQYHLNIHKPRLANHTFLQVDQYEKEIRKTQEECFATVRIIRLNEKIIKLSYRNNNNSNDIENGDLIHTTSIKENAIPIKNGVVRELQNCRSEAESIKQYCYEKHLDCNKTQILNESYYETEIQKLEKNVQDLQNYLDAVAITNYVQPTVYALVFIVGFVGNFLLLYIFYRNRKCRKPQNMIIFNLALSDTLSLIINLPLFYAYGATGAFGIKVTSLIIMFCRYLCFSLSVFSTVALCLQRYSATLKASNYVGHILRQSTSKSAKVANACIWILACMFAIPFGVHSDIYFFETYQDKKNIYMHSIQVIYMFQLMALGILPLIVISVLSWLTVRSFNERCKKIPVDIPQLHREYQIRVLSRSTRIIKMCPVVFASTWLPFFLFYALRNFFDLDINSKSDAMMKVIVTSLLFLGCSVNPIGLYVASGNFRHYMRSIFGLGPRKSSLKYQHQEERPSNCISIEPSTQDTKL